MHMHLESRIKLSLCVCTQTPFNPSTTDMPSYPVGYRVIHGLRRSCECCQGRHSSPSSPHCCPFVAPDRQSINAPMTSVSVPQNLFVRERKRLPGAFGVSVCIRPSVALFRLICPFQLSLNHLLASPRARVIVHPHTHAHLLSGLRSALLDDPRALRRALFRRQRTGRGALELCDADGGDCHANVCHVRVEPMLFTSFLFCIHLKHSAKSTSTTEER